MFNFDSDVIDTKDDFRRESEEYSESVSQRSRGPLIDRRTPEEKEAARIAREHEDRVYAKYQKECSGVYAKLRSFDGRPEPKNAMVIARLYNGARPGLERLEAYEPDCIDFVRSDHHGTRLTIAEAKKLQKQFPVYLANTAIVPAIRNPEWEFLERMRAKK